MTLTCLSTLTALFAKLTSLFLLTDADLQQRAQAEAQNQVCAHFGEVMKSLFTFEQVNLFSLLQPMTSFPPQPLQAKRTAELEAEIVQLKAAAAAGGGVGVMSRLFQIPTKEDVLNGEDGERRR